MDPISFLSTESLDFLNVETKYPNKKPLWVAWPKIFNYNGHFVFKFH